MSETEFWLTHYGETHRDISFAWIYWVAVLMLVIATVGMLWSLPVPYEFERISPILNWGSTFLMAAAIYYFIISMPLAIGLLPFVFGVAAIQAWLVESPFSLARVSTGLFALSVVGLYAGQYASGGLRGVIRDIQLMMIAPAWMLSVLYRKFGIPY